MQTPRAPRYGVTMDETADPIAYWNGPAGERWAREQEAIDRAFAAFSAKLFDRATLRPGARVLDVGCGCGTTTLAAADAVGPGGAVVGIDVSTPMVARARERSTGRPNVSYVLADAAEHGFETPFDAIVSRFGVMFFRRPVPAFRRMREALRSGGTLAFVCWRAANENEWVRVARDAVDLLLPAEPAESADEPGPFAFADSGRVAAILDEASFTNVAVVAFDADVVLSQQGLGEAARFAMTTGPTARRLRDADDDTKARVRVALEARLRPFVRGERIALRGSVWVVSATRS